MRIINVLRVAFPLAGLGIAAALVFGRDREPGVKIPAGTTLVAVLGEAVSTQRSEPGDEIELLTVAPVRLADGTEIPEGSVIGGVVTDARNGSRNGPPELGIRFTELEIDGSDHDITTEQFRFGTLNVGPSMSDQIALPAGQQIRIRLSRPVTIAYRPSEQVRWAE